MNLLRPEHDTGLDTHARVERALKDAQDPNLVRAYLF